MIPQDPNHSLKNSPALHYSAVSTELPAHVKLQKLAPKAVTMGLIPASELEAYTSVHIDHSHVDQARGIEKKLRRKWDKIEDISPEAYRKQRDTRMQEFRMAGDLLSAMVAQKCFQALIANTRIVVDDYPGTIDPALVGRFKKGQFSKDDFQAIKQAYEKQDTIARNTSYEDADQPYCKLSALQELFRSAVYIHEHPELLSGA